jgi:hypothetical protein
VIGDVVRPAELGGADLDVWRASQQAPGAIDNPFLTSDFALVIGAVRPAARVAILREGSDTSFLAFERHRLGFARPIGDGMSDSQGVVGAEVLDGQALLHACDLHLWRFDHLLGDQAARLAPAAPQVPSAVIDLDGGFDAYLAGRRTASKTLVATAERKARKLGREVGPLRFAPDEVDHRLVDQVISWKRAQYQRSGVPDVLAAPATQALLHRFLDARGDAFSGLLSVLYAGDVPVAVHLGLRTPTVVAWWFPAYDPPTPPTRPASRCSCASPSGRRETASGASSSARGTRRTRAVSPAPTRTWRTGSWRGPMPVSPSSSSGVRRDGSAASDLPPCRPTRHRPEGRRTGRSDVLSPHRIHGAVPPRAPPRLAILPPVTAWAVVLAAGSGARFGAAKQYALLGRSTAGRPGGGRGGGRM